MNRFIVLLLIVLTIALTGCQEEKKVWGKGELPADWIETFGDDNQSRLLYVESQIIDKINKRLIVLEEEAIPEVVEPEPKTPDK